MGELLEIERLQHELDLFYDQKVAFREKGRIRLLQLFTTTYDIFDASRYGFEYEAVHEKDIVSVLNRILSFKPDIIMSQDSIIKAKRYYDHQHILYIDDNDYSAYIWLFPYMTINKNEMHFYDWKNCFSSFGRLYGDDSVYRHVICSTLAPGAVFMEPELDIPDEFDTDICIVAGSNSSVSRIKAYIEYSCMTWMKHGGSDCLREKLKTVLYNMIDIFLQRMDETGELLEDLEVYEEVFWELAEEFADEFRGISLESQKYFFKLIRMLIGYGAYRRLIAKWVVESGYRVELWGDSWENEYGVEKYYKGKVCDREELKRIYNRSKICLFTNPDFGLHTSMFEMVSSKTLCLAYNNDNITLASVKDYFVDGESIVLYKNRTELMEKITYYLQHMEQRKEIICRGYHIVKENKLYREWQLTKVVEKAVELAKQNMDMS